MLNPGIASSTTRTVYEKTDLLFMEKTLIGMYPRLQKYDSTVGRFLHGAIISENLINSIKPGTRRIIEIGCGDGVLSNSLSLLFPNVQIIGIDSSPYNVANARTTVGDRKNIQFHCGNPGLMNNIPCDRIIYNDMLSRSKSIYAFKKMILNTSEWIVSEGDFVVRESAVGLMKNIPIWRDLVSRIQVGANLQQTIQTLVQELGAQTLNQSDNHEILGQASSVAIWAKPGLSLTQLDIQDVSEKRLIEFKKTGTVVAEPKPKAQAATVSQLDALFNYVESDFRETVAR